MSTINLAVKEETKDYGSFLRNSLMSALITLIIVGGVYGTLVFLNKKVEAQIQDVTNQYSAEYNKFLVGDANEVLDFKNRVDSSNTFLKQDKSMTNVLNQIEATVLPQVYLSSLVYDDNTVDIICVADSYDTEAKQIMAFKNNPALSSFVFNKGYTDSQTGQLSFDVSFKVK